MLAPATLALLGGGARLVLYGGAMTGLGYAWLAVQSATGLITDGAARHRTTQRIGSALLAAAPLLLLQLQLAALEMGRSDLPLLLGETAWGQGWTLLTLACLSASVLLWFPATRRTRPFLWVATLAVASAMGGLGHAAADDQYPLVARAVDALHVISLGVWLGGLFVTYAATRIDPPTAGGDLWRRFSASATVAAPLTVLTGVVSSWLRLHGAEWPVAFTTTYVQLLVAKGGIVGAVLWYGASQRQRIGRGESPVAAAVRQELLLALVVLLLTALLTGSEPPERLMSSSLGA